MKVTAQMNAFLHPESSATTQELQTEKGVRRMAFFSDMEYWIKLGYTYIGPVTITVDVPDERTLVDSKVEALRGEIVATRAESTAKITRLEGQIQQLLCIENNPSAAAPQ